jgi:tetratricopeptide (TPR) repeat protein
MTITKLGRLARVSLVVAGLSLALSVPVLAFDDPSPSPGGGGGSQNSGGKSMGGGGGGGVTHTPTLADARADIKLKHWNDAVTVLKAVVAADPKSADAYNLLGFSYRNLGKLDLAGKAYARALKLDPKHAGALEYQGILFVKQGETDKAKANLALIKTIKGTGSEEYKELAEALGS